MPQERTFSTGILWPVTAIGFDATSQNRSCTVPRVRINGGWIVIQRNASDKSLATIRLLTVNNKLIYATDTDQEMVIYAEFNPGMYLVTVKTGGQELVKIFAVAK